MQRICLIATAVVISASFVSTIYRPRAQGPANDSEPSYSQQRLDMALQNWSLPKGIHDFRGAAIGLSSKNLIYFSSLCTGCVDDRFLLRESPPPNITLMYVIVDTPKYVRKDLVLPDRVHLVLDPKSTILPDAQSLAPCWVAIDAHGKIMASGIGTPYREVRHAPN